MFAKLYPVLLLVVFPLVVLGPSIARLFLVVLGGHLRRKTQQRRDILISRVKAERELLQAQSDGSRTSQDDDWEKVEDNTSAANNSSTAAQGDKDWNGIIGFFHPFCNAGGGGERVLWAAIRATQNRYPKAICVVYTGDHECDKEQMLQRVEDRFNIHLNKSGVVFLYLTTRSYILASSWPHFTLLGQSLGSLVLGYDAFTLLVPDVFIDTMGYAFALALSSYLFPEVPTAAYVHYPTISTDMLSSLNAEAAEGRGLHAGGGKGWRGAAKRMYWNLFARLYGWVGGHIDVVMTNSSWTQQHIQQIWGPARKYKKRGNDVTVVFPPCAVEELEQKIIVTAESERDRKPTLIYISQFRPEKNHQLILRAFSKYLQNTETPANNSSKDTPHLLLIGSVRDSVDETYVYSLRLLAHELHITASVTFLLNANWPTILNHLQTASVGVNAMWNEHFGIGVVEYQAAGLISVVNDSGGPKRDICVDTEEGPTGFHASTEQEYAVGISNALALSNDDALALRLRARKSAKRFDERAFDQRWVLQLEKLIHR